MNRRSVRNAASRKLVPKCQSLCSDCVDWESDIDGIRSPFRFEGMIRKAVHEFKYRNLRAIAGSWQHLLGEYLVENPIPYDVIVPVPLHH